MTQATPLFAVVVADDENQHARSADEPATLCGLAIPANEKAVGRFPTVTGTLCGACVDVAFLPVNRSRTSRRHTS